MQTDILIVGAGLSGLVLASSLARRGSNYLLIEARERVGGRILSVQSDMTGRTTGWLDLGPSWVWPGQPRIARLLEELDIGVFEQYSEGRLVYQDEAGQVRRDYDFSTMAGSLRIEGGISSITQRLYNRLPSQTVFLSHLLSSITEAEDGFIAAIKTPAGNKTIRARRIVLSVPPRLVAETIDFGTTLSAEILEGLGSIPTWMGGHAKLFTVHEKPFWRDMGLSGDGISRYGPLMEIHDASPADAGFGALFGFLRSPIDSLSREPDSLVAGAIEQLQQMFGPAAADPINVITQDWSKEVFTATVADTSTSHHPEYGQPDSLQPLVHKGLLFASTEMAPKFGGFIEGALEAAEIVLDQL